LNVLEFSKKTGDANIEELLVEIAANNSESFKNFLLLSDMLVFIFSM